MVVALTALFIGLLTAVISIYSASVDRAYAKASVWPKLEIYRSYDIGKFSYGVVNKGTGPAIIKYAKVTANGQYLKKWSELPELRNIYQSHISTITLPSGQRVQPLTYKGNLNMLELDRGIGIELCYCSIYEDCWVVDRSNITQEIKECVISPEQAFEQ